MEQLTKIQAIKRYFEADGGRKVELAELRALPATDRDELAVLAAKELGVELSSAPPVGS